MLENHADFFAAFSQLFDGERRQIFPRYDDASLCGRLQKINGADECGFSRSRVADDAVHIALLYGKGHIVHRRKVVAVALKDDGNML